MTDETPRLYVGNLPYVAQKADIENLFAKHDISVKKIDIAIDAFTGRNPSYCFVDFHSPDDAAQAMDKLQGEVVRGRPVRINLKTERRPTINRPPTKTYDRGWRAQEVPSLDANQDSFAFDRWNREDASEHWTKPEEEKRRLYVGGLPRIPQQDSLNVEMRDIFKDYNVQAVSKLISPHASKVSESGSQYFCFVDLPTAQDAQHAMEALNGTPTSYGGTLQVRIAFHRGSTMVQREQLEASNRIYVAGLTHKEDQNALEAEIRDLFSGWTVESVSKLITPRDETLARKGTNDYYFCFVELPTANEARDAVEALDGKSTPQGGTYKIRTARDRLPSKDSRGTPSNPTDRSRAPQPDAPPRDFSKSWRRTD